MVLDDAVKKLPYETEEQYIWKIGQMVDSGKFTWSAINDTINSELGIEEDKWRDESAFRKRYKAAKQFYLNCFSKMRGEQYSDDVNAQMRDMQIERQKLADERNSYTRILRQQARSDANWDYFEMLIRESGAQKYNSNSAANKQKSISGDDLEMAVCLSDLHLGLDFANSFGNYNSDICNLRLHEYALKVIQIAKQRGIRICHVLLLGDLISGNIHFTTQLENRENVVEQVQKVAEYISDFVYDLSQHFDAIYVNGVSGNHSRVGLKENVLRGERLDALIIWYLKAKLSSIKRIEFTDTYNFDGTVGTETICGNPYLLVHGDYDQISESSVGKLITTTRTNPTGIFVGHLHTPSYSDVCGIHVVRSGSMCGSGDDYTVSKRLCGKPSQTAVICDSDGIESIYPIYF